MRAPFLPKPSIGVHMFNLHPIRSKNRPEVVYRVSSMRDNGRLGKLTSLPLAVELEHGNDDT